MRQSITIIAVLLLFVCLSDIYGQKQPFGAFQLPENAKYQKGKIAFKLKANFKEIFSSPSPDLARLQDVFAAIGTQEKIPQQLFGFAEEVRNSKQSSFFRIEKKNKSGVDLNLYYELNFNPQHSIEKAINLLLATGIIDYAEPVYKYSNNYVPNDPDLKRQYYLDVVKAQEAWDIQKGDTNVVIAIVDGGVEIEHPDMKPNIKYNWADPVNGKDDDNNGLVDDFAGWDFVGGDTLKVQADNDPSPKFGDGRSHGLWVAGVAAAAGDNNTGIAGMAYRCKILAIKNGFDNDLDGSVTGGYVGVLYASQRKAKVINCSFGGSNYSQIFQDVCNLVALDRDGIVVAAAGNGDDSGRGRDIANYPAGYDNVISVASSNANDIVSSFSDYSFSVDVVAPGENMVTTTFNKTTGNSFVQKGRTGAITGTSFSAPMVAGAIALVRSQYPQFTGLQAGELIRITADNIYAINNPAYQDRLGKGRLNIKRALSEKSPAIRLLDYQIRNQRGNTAVAGDTALFSGLFINYLWKSTPNLRISVSSTSNYLRIVQGNLAAGEIDMMKTYSNSGVPFRMIIAQNTPQNTEIAIKVSYKDGNYEDFQYFTIVVNPSFFIINQNLVTTSMGSRGRIGYDEFLTGEPSNGIGFIFEENDMLYEMGLMMATSPTQIANAVRGASQDSYDNDFIATRQIREVNPTVISAYDLEGSFSDQNARNRALNTTTTFKSFTWKETEHSKYTVIEYTIKNTGTASLNNFYAGLYADWDIDGTEPNKADWNEANKFGYIYSTQGKKHHAGIKLLTSGKPNYYAIDNDHRVTGNPLGVYDGFSYAEKFTSLSSGTDTKNKAGDFANSNDVSHTVASGPHTIAVGDSVKIAFALMAGTNFEDLVQVAKNADLKYNTVINLRRPSVADAEVCANQRVTIRPTGASRYKWYTDISGGNAFFTGAAYTTSALRADTALFISNADGAVESLRTRVNVRVNPVPQINAVGGLRLCEGQSTTLTSTVADEYLWSNGATTRSITVRDAGTFTVTTKNKKLNCSETSPPLSIEKASNPFAAFTSNVNEIEFRNTVNFTDQSTDATSWEWSFGDGGISTNRNPSYTFNQIGDFTVKLTVKSADGCTSTTTQKLIKVTSVADEIFSRGVNVYPNPNQGVFKLKIENEKMGEIHVVLYGVLGSEMRKFNISKASQSFETELNIGSVSKGIYFLHIKSKDGNTVRKISIE
ncbi:MAG: T9SS C-terminal target domain-containing protein [Cytophagales bacterium]|nr:MAG: T9SS C-terminal target domain-containing protein [Cytophagales bacterium]